MNRVTVELWLWLGNELKGEFSSLSEMRSVREEVIEEGTSIGDLLHSLGNRCLPIRQHVFDTLRKKLDPNVFLIYNDQVLPADMVLQRVLKGGDKITIMPLYTGG